MMSCHFKNQIKMKEINSNLERLMRIGCEYWKVTPEYINQKSRKREILEKRQILQYIAVSKNLYSLKRIGLFFGGKDHATAHHSKVVISNLLSEEYIATDVEEITKRFDNVTVEQQATELKKQIKELQNELSLLVLKMTDDTKNTLQTRIGLP